jgi:anaphase-promoting complex subunit 3
VEPNRIENMDMYSTVLWHLKDDASLCSLAQEMEGIDRQSPIAWVVMGNAFSLQQEQENALKCFQRAIQLDPSYAYAHNLCGHEYFANDAFDRALESFRLAIRHDSMMYSSWYRARVKGKGLLCSNLVGTVSE